MEGRLGEAYIISDIWRKSKVDPPMLTFSSELHRIFLALVILTPSKISVVFDRGRLGNGSKSAVWFYSLSVRKKENASAPGNFFPWSRCVRSLICFSKIYTKKGHFMHKITGINRN